MSGCSVFTRPSSISGAPVTAATSVTAMPAPESAAAVPPLDTSSQPSSARPWARSVNPVLSYTDSSALMATSSCRWERQVAVGDRLDRVGIEPPFDGLDALVQGVDRVVGPDLDGFLRQDGAVVDHCGGNVDGAARHSDTGGHRFFDRVPPGKRRKQGGVGVEDATGVGLEGGLGQDRAEARHCDQIEAVLGERVEHPPGVADSVEVVAEARPLDDNGENAVAGGHLGGGTGPVDDHHDDRQPTAAERVENGATTRGQDTDAHDAATYQWDHRSGDGRPQSLTRRRLLRYRGRECGHNNRRGPVMDLDKLTLGDKVVAGSAIGLFIFSLLPWYTFDAGLTGSASRSGLDYTLTGLLPLLIGLAMLGYVALRAISPETELPELPVPYGLVLLGLGCGAAVLVILRFLVGDGVDLFDLDRSIGLFLAVLAAIGLAVGGFLKMQEDDDAQPGSGDTPTSF